MVWFYFMLVFHKRLYFVPDFKTTGRRTFGRTYQEQPLYPNCENCFCGFIYGLAETEHVRLRTVTLFVNSLAEELPKSFGGAGMAQWWEHSPSTYVARVRFPDSTSYVGWVCCWFSSLLREVFPSGFPLCSKTNISKFQFDPECSSV